MKYALPIAFLLTSAGIVCGQSSATVPDDYTGVYHSRIDTSLLFVVKKKKGQLYLQIVGQGEVGLSRAGRDKFKANRVRPEAIVEFARDPATGQVQMKWIQKMASTRMVRTASPEADSLARQTGEWSRFVGNYQLSKIRNKTARVRVVAGQLAVQFSGEGSLRLQQESGNRFVIQDGEMRMTFDFLPNAVGQIEGIEMNRQGGVTFVKSKKQETVAEEVVYGFNRPNGFTRADTLRGALTPLRSNFDVLFYDLQVTVDPDNQRVEGANTIRFKATQELNRLQLDLFSNMRVKQILFRNQPLPYTRESHAIFVQFPAQLRAGLNYEITVAYDGKPQRPDGASLAGGIFWLQDKQGNPWIETVTQGAGASLWWPCKDHLSDKPDSMRIRVSVPKGMTNISNGVLRRQTESRTHTTTEWYVSYPITTYCIALNIGDYVHLTDQRLRGSDTLKLHYYSKPYDLEQGRKLFRHVKPMLSVFEKYFGPYPFSRDGLTVMESIYPMEHQGAVTFGSLFNPFNSDRYDSADILRTMWHEVAHEWWGNHITVKDYADMWVHEAFATYAEALAYRELQGPEAALRYLNGSPPDNKQAIIGTYGVNDFHMGDMYTKGALMLHTLQHVINNDTVWFGLLRSIQTQFAHQTITSDDVIQFINDYTKTDYTAFFRQYLNHPAIPQLLLKFERRGKDTVVLYRWKTDEPAFAIPVQVTTTRNNFAFIQPTQQWKELNIGAMKRKDFRVDTSHFYVGVKEE